MSTRLTITLMGSLTVVVVCIAAHRGKKRALSAVGHSVLVMIYHLLTKRVPYHELGAQYFDDREWEHVQQRLVHRSERLGFAVTLESSATSF